MSRQRMRAHDGRVSTRTGYGEQALWIQIQTRLEFLSNVDNSKKY